MDQLAQLKDIHLPEQVHQWPISIGWWLLLASMIFVISLACIKYIKQRRLTAVKRQAITQLEKNQNLTTIQCVSILKWTCMHYYSRQDIAALHGNDLAEFLSSKIAKPLRADFIEKIREALEQYYRKVTIDIYAEDFQNASLFWLKNANLISKTQTKEKSEAQTEPKTDKQSNEPETSPNTSKELSHD